MSKSEKRQRQELVGLRLTALEKAAIEARAEALSLTVVGLIRVQLGLEPQPATMTVAVDGLANRIAAEIRQHLFGDPDYPSDETDCCAEAVVDLLQSLAVR